MFNLSYRHFAHILGYAHAEKGNFMQRLGLKKQGSKTLATNPSPDSGNPYPMASGGHHPGRWGSHDQTQSNPQPQQPNFGQQQQGYSGLDNPHDDATAVAAAVAASELAVQESGRLSEQRSVGQEQEEQAMVDLAIKVLFLFQQSKAACAVSSFCSNDSNVLAFFEQQ